MIENCDFSVFTKELSSLSKTGYFKVNLCDDSCVANDEWYETFGAEVGMRMTDVFRQSPYVHPVDYYAINSFLENAKKGYEKKFRGYMRVRIPGRDLTWRWYQVFLLITNYAPDMKMIEMVGMQYEVSGLMGDGEQSMMAISQMTDLLQSFNTIAWTYDFRTKVIVTNRSLVTGYGFDSPVSQMSIDEFFSQVLPEYINDVKAVYDSIETGKVPRGTVEFQMHLDNKPNPLWVRFAIIAQEYDETGRALTAIGSTTIIQEQKMAEKAIEEAKKKAEHANQVKTNFLSSMSHEFRTPLNAILGFSTIMAHSDTIEERMQCLGAIQSSGSQMLQMVDDVLDFAQIEAGEIVFKLERANIVALMSRMTEEITPRRQPGVEVKFSSSEPEIYVYGDYRHINSVAKHLISNAAKYTKRGCIEVRVERDIKYAIVKVKDTGHGMSKECVSHIFDRFYKGNEYVPGAGLGLSIVKKLVTQWKGDIGVESVQDEGTTFTFTVPLFTHFY